MIISVAQAQLFFLALTRILAIIVQVPVLAGPVVPNQVKIGFGVLLAIALLPWQPLASDVPSLGLLPFGIAIAQELLIGITAGFAATLVFSALQMAGELMGLGSGFAAGRVLNPALGSSGSALDQFFLMMALLLFFILNGHHSFLLGLQRTFSVLPLNSALPDLNIEQLLRLTAEMIAAGVQMALPVMGALLLTDIATGFLARVAPQIQVFFLAVPVKVGIGLFALALTIGILVPTFSDLFHAIGRRAISLFGG